MRADSAPRTLRPIAPVPHQHPIAPARPARWAEVPNVKPEPFGWFGRWSRRSRLAATVVVIASLALVGALVISSAQAVKAVAGTSDQARYGRTIDQGADPGSLPAEP